MYRRLVNNYYIYLNNWFDSYWRRWWRQCWRRRKQRTSYESNWSWRRREWRSPKRTKSLRSRKNGVDNGLKSSKVDSRRSKTTSELTLYQVKGIADQEHESAILKLLSIIIITSVSLMDFFIIFYFPDKIN